MAPVRSLLRRFTRRCDIHDKPSPYLIRQMKQELGMEPSAPTGRLVEEHSNPRLIDCGRTWCQDRR